MFSMLSRNLSRTYPLATSWLRGHSSPILPATYAIANYSSKLPPKNAKNVEMVTLFDLKGHSMGKKTKLEAELIAKKLNAILAVDAKKATSPPAYCIVGKGKVALDDSADAVDNGEDTKAEECATKPFAVSGSKRLTLSCNITDHDLETRCNQIQRWVEKLAEVFVVINGSGQVNQMESVYTKIESRLPDARFLQKRKKGNNLKFTISPDPKKADIYAAACKAHQSDHPKTMETEIGIEPDKLFSEKELESMMEEIKSKKE